LHSTRRHRRFALAAITALALPAVVALAPPGRAQEATRGAVALSGAVAREDLPFDPADSVGLFVGVRTFELDGKPSQILSDIPYAVDDAVDLAFAFSMELHLIPPCGVTLCLGGQPQKVESSKRLEQLIGAGAHESPATYMVLRNQVRRLGSAGGPKGLLVLSLATHGVSIAGIDCLLAQDSPTADPGETLQVTWLRDMTAAAVAPRRILFLDTCRRKVKLDRGFDDASRLSPSFSEALGGIEGSVTLFASPAGGYSYDDRTKRNGVFTGALLEALAGAAEPDAHGLITLGAVARHANSSVIAWIRQNVEANETPTGIDFDGPLNLLELPLAERLQPPAAAPDARPEPATVPPAAPAGSRLLVAARQGRMELWDVAAGERLASLDNGSELRSAAFCAASGVVLTGGGTTPRVWRAASGIEGVTLGRHGDTVSAVAISRDGSQLLTASTDGTARTWDASTGAVLRTFPRSLFGSLPPLRAVAISGDGTRVVTGGSGAMLWDARQGVQLGPLPGPRGSIEAVAFSPDGTLVASGGLDLSAWLHSVPAQEAIGQPLRHEGEVWAVAFSADGRKLLTGSSANRNGAILWDVATCEVLGVLDDRARITCVACSPDGRWMATGGADGCVRIFEAGSGSMHATMQLASPVMSLSFG